MTTVTTPPAKLDIAAIRERATFVRDLGQASGSGRLTAVADDNDALIAEVERLRAVLGRVQDLADAARGDRHDAPVEGTIAVVTYTGGYPAITESRERVFLRSDDPEKADSYRDGQWWDVSGNSSSPLSWDEVNAYDDPPCDRPSVTIEPYLSVDILDAALAGGAA